MSPGLASRRALERLGALACAWLLAPCQGCAHPAAATFVAPAPVVAVPSPPPARPGPVPLPAPAPAPAPRLPIVPLGLRLRVSPPDATLEINGRDRGIVSGPAAREALRALAPGVYRIVLRREGRLSWRGEVAVGTVAQAVEVTLPEVADPKAEEARSDGAAP